MTGSKIKIMIVEDESIIAMDEKFRLIKLGYEVTTIANCFENAITGIQQNRPDLVLMDLNIKGEIKGIETAQYIWSYFNIPSLFITAYDCDDIKEKIAKLNAVGILTKPLDDFKFQKLMLTFHPLHSESLSS